MTVIPNILLLFLSTNTLKEQDIVSSAAKALKALIPREIRGIYVTDAKGKLTTTHIISSLPHSLLGVTFHRK